MSRRSFLQWLLEGDSLSPRELEVLERAAAGDRAKETALRLGIAHDTVLTYQSRAKAKLGARTIAQATAEGVRKGLIV